MSFQFIKKMFFIGPRPKELRAMLSLTENAHNALSYIAENTGETIQKVITDMLEIYLTELVKEGKIPSPVVSKDEAEQAVTDTITARTS